MTTLDEVSLPELPDGVAADGAQAPAGAEGAPAAPRVAGTIHTYQALLGFVATMLSLGGTGSTLPKLLMSHGPGKGDVAVIVRDAKAGSAVMNANIEILTAENALLTTLTSDEGGQALRSLREGRYRVRVRHPRYATETQAAVITKGMRTVVPVRLVDDVPSASPRGIEQRPAPHPQHRSAPPQPTPFSPREHADSQAG